MTIISYKQYKDRAPDTQYGDLLRFIRASPETYYVKHPKQDTGRYFNLVAPHMEFKFENGFPIITDRKIPFWKTPITELLLFMRGVRMLKEMQEAGCGWWADWLTVEKAKLFNLDPEDMGPGSYAVLHDLPTPEGAFNQVENLVQSLKDGPDYNTHVISTWYAPYAMQHSTLRRKVVVAPCHGTLIQATVIDRRKLVVKMNQRSGDVPVGVVSNIIQYAAFTIMLAHVCGYEPYMYVHQVDNAQIYENQIEKVDLVLKRNPYPFPSLYLTEEGQKITNIFDFTADHFDLRDYHSHPGMKIPYVN